MKDCTAFWMTSRNVGSASNARLLGRLLVNKLSFIIAKSATFTPQKTYVNQVSKYFRTLCLKVCVNEIGDNFFLLNFHDIHNHSFYRVSISFSGYVISMFTSYFTLCPSLGNWTCRTEVK